MSQNINKQSQILRATLYQQRSFSVIFKHACITSIASLTYEIDLCNAQTYYAYNFYKLTPNRQI